MINAVQGMSSRDKRRYPRVQAKNVSAHLNVADQSSPCVIQNISAGGIFIETSDALPVGMPVAVNLARPGWTKVLRLSGRVVWALAERTAARKGTTPGMRIKFDALTKGCASELMALLEALGAPSSPAPNVIGQEPAVGVTTQPVSIKEIQARVSQTGLAAMTVDVLPKFANEAPKLIVQVQGLLVQVAELRARLELREKELSALKERLKEKETALDRADRERKAAELAIQRLSMQLSSRR